MSASVIFKLVLNVYLPFLDLYLLSGVTWTILPSSSKACRLAACPVLPIWSSFWEHPGLYDPRDALKMVLSWTYLLKLGGILLETILYL